MRNTKIFLEKLEEKFPADNFGHHHIAIENGRLTIYLHKSQGIFPIYLTEDDIDFSPDDLIADICNAILLSNDPDYDDLKAILKNEN